MLLNEKPNLESTMSADSSSLDAHQNIHKLGVSYLSNLLNHVGFAIVAVNTDPNHHFQLLARIKSKSLLIAVRTACHPDAGTIDSSSLEMLVRESEKLSATPHFAGLSVKPLATNDTEVNDLSESQGYKVIFNGISAVRKSELRAVNG